MLDKCRIRPTEQRKKRDIFGCFKLVDVKYGYTEGQVIIGMSKMQYTPRNCLKC